MNKVETIFGEPSERTVPGVLTWLRQSKYASIAWLAVRVWVGCMWFQAGWAKVFGAENPYFLHHNGAGVAGFAGHGIPAYSWWGSLMHSFVVPNASWIAVIVAFGELAIGIGLVAGFMTRTAAVCSLLLLFTYIMSGTASVCAFYALCALIVLATWRTSSWFGVDGLIAGFRQRRRNAVPVEAAPVAAETSELVSVG
ncbi:MAG: DoxX family protein [Acidimicrobiales bacterium]|jgi:thiosulfate dehydrogenase [quinone] large subunit